MAIRSLKGHPMNRIWPNVVVRHPSPNNSSRLGAHPTLITVHATAGHNIRNSIADLAGLGNFFANPAAEVSSHTASDNDGNSARFVGDHLKAWHCMAFNRMSLGIEQVLPGTGAEITEALYRETARWLALWSRSHNIPLRQGARDGFRIVRSGVMFHSQLGAPGGGHADPGRGYSMDHLLELARYIKRKQNNA